MQMAQVAHAAGGPPVVAVYYAWYDPGSWAGGKTADAPVTPYQSDDKATIQRQVSQAEGAGIDGFELNWWGPGDRTDNNLKTLLSVAHGTSFKVAAYVDLAGPTFNTPGDVINALNYLKSYENDPSYFHSQGKPFVAFYHTVKFDVATWQSILGQVDPGRSTFWMAEGTDMSQLSVFDGIHPFSIAWASNPNATQQRYASQVAQHLGKSYMATVMPGYDDTRLGRGAAGFAVDRQGGNYYNQLWQGAIAVNPAIVSITSWNEWMEGSQIEPSETYGDLYLQETRQWSAQFKGAPAAQAAPAGATSAFYTQAGSGKGGYSIADDGAITFYDAFQNLGGVDALGYPASQRFVKDGFTYQALQGAILQWQPASNQAVLANTFEWFTTAGLDQQLLQTKSIPLPIQDDGSNGDFNKAKATRLSWLTDPAIKGTYLGAGSEDAAIQLYGLPMSKPEQHGPFVVQRFQRIAFQHWTDSVPGMPAPGSVVRVLGGDLAKELGLVPAAAQTPTTS